MLITLAINLLIVGYIALREFHLDARNMQKIPLSSVRVGYLLLGIGCFLIALLMDYLKYHRMLMVTESVSDKQGAFSCAALGKYYDNITPFGAGGQPFQMAYLKRRGYSVGASASLPICGFLSQQISFVIIAVVVMILNSAVINDLPAIRVSAYAGLLMYMLLPAGILLFSYAPKPFEKLLGSLIRFLGRIRLLKRPEETEKKIYHSLHEYVKGIRTINRRPHFFIKLLGFSLIYQIAILSIPFFMLRTFGGGNPYWTVFCLVVYIYAAITIIPTPGNSGAAEGSFYAVFASLEGGYLFWAMICWRVLVYFSWLAVGIFVMTRTVSGKRAEKKEIQAAERVRVALFTEEQNREEGDARTTREDHAMLIDAIGGSSRVVSWKKRELGEEDYTAFLVYSPFSAGYLALLLARKFKQTPVVAVICQNYYQTTLKKTGSRFLANAAANRAIDFCTLADEVWVKEKEDAAWLLERGYQGEIKLTDVGLTSFAR